MLVDFTEAGARALLDYGLDYDDDLAYVLILRYHRWD